MIVRYDIEQGTEEWYKVRYGKIGGTTSAGLFVNSDTLLLSLLAELTEPIDLDYDSYVSEDMQRGIELEPIARKSLSEYIGIELLQAGWLQSTEHELLGVSPDGISKCETITAEIKCPGSKKHIETLLSNEIPLDNLKQCIHYFTVNPKLEKHYFCSYRPESIKPMFVKELNRNSLVNLGTKAKPVMKTIAECVSIAKNATIVLEGQIEEAIEKLKF